MNQSDSVLSPVFNILRNFGRRTVDRPAPCETHGSFRAKRIAGFGLLEKKFSSSMNVPNCVQPR